MPLDPRSYAQGWREQLDLPSPAAGADFSYTVPGEVWERPLTIGCVFTTSATEVNRSLRLVFRGPNDAIYVASIATVYLPANRAARFVWMPGAAPGDYQYDLAIQAPMPEAVIESGQRWQLQVGNRQGGDQISAVTYYVERYRTGPPRARLRRGPVGRRFQPGA